MASFFGSVATEVGGAVKEHGERAREDRHIDEEAQRDMQLQKQRMTHESTLTQQKIDADDVLATRRIESDYALAGYEAATRATQQTLQREHDTSIEGMRQEGANERKLYDIYAARNKGGTKTGGGWTRQVELKPEMDMETGQQIQKEYVYFSGPDNRLWRQIGDKVIDPGDNKPPVTWQATEGKTAEQNQADAESLLYSGEVTEEQFKRKFRYLPADYLYLKLGQGDKGYQKWKQDYLGEKSGAQSRQIDAMPGEVKEIVEQASAQYGVPSELIRSVIAAESSGRTEAVSPKGATGLMQLMEGTAADLGVTDRTDPAQNIPGGTLYLSQMMKRYNGDIALALAAYNDGPSDVDKYANDPNWITKAPKETQAYVAKVLGKYYSLAQAGTGPLSEAAAAPEAAPAPDDGVGPPAPAAPAEAVEMAEWDDTMGPPSELTDEEAASIAETVAGSIGGGIMSAGGEIVKSGKAIGRMFGIGEEAEAE